MLSSWSEFVRLSERAFCEREEGKTHDLALMLTCVLDLSLPGRESCLPKRRKERGASCWAAGEDGLWLEMPKRREVDNLFRKVGGCRSPSTGTKYRISTPPPPTSQWR